MGMHNNTTVTEMGLISTEVYDDSYFNINAPVMNAGNSDYIVVDKKSTIHTNYKKH